MANCRNQNNVDTLHLTPFTINYGHFRCQALTECCRYGERETGDWQCHHITAILIPTEISQRAPSGHFHQSWGAIVYLVDIFISLRHTYILYSIQHSKDFGFYQKLQPAMQCQFRFCVFCVIVGICKVSNCSMQGKWELFFKWGLENFANNMGHAVF